MAGEITTAMMLARIQGVGAIPESRLLRFRQAYMSPQPVSDAAMISTTPVTKSIIATTKGKYATGSRAATSLDSSITCELAEIGPTSMTELKLEINNWWFLANSTEEQINTGTVGVEAILVEVTTGLRKRFKFGGVNAGTVPITVGAARLLSDALLPSDFGLVVFPAYTKWQLVIRRTAASSSDALPWHGTNQSLTRELEYEYQYASGTSNAAAIAAAYLDAAPALSLYAKDGSNVSLGQVSGPARPNSGASGISVAGGFVLLGRANGATRACVFLTDSIGDGTNDTQSPQPTDTGNGWIGRSILGTDGLPICSVLKATISGDRAQYRDGVNTLSRNGLAQATHCIIALGVNDLAGTRTLAQLRTNVYSLAALAKAQGCTKVLVASITPKTNSTDSWAGDANQSFSTPTDYSMFDPGGTHIRQDFNAQMATDAAGAANNIDGYIDFTTVTDSGPSTGKWIAGGTSDGTHPLPAIHALMAPIARAAILALPAAIV